MIQAVRPADSLAFHPLLLERVYFYRSSDFGALIHFFTLFSPWRKGRPHDRRIDGRVDQTEVVSEENSHPL
jgi:hypothetical protein